MHSPVYRIGATDADRKDRDPPQDNGIDCRATKYIPTTTIDRTASLYSMALQQRYVSDDGRIALRLLDPADVTDRYLSWFRDEEVTGFLEARNLSRADVVQYIEEGRRTGVYEMLAICEAGSGLHIGNVKIGPIDRRHGLADLPTVIGDKTYWGKGLATSAIVLGSRIAFEDLDIRKLSGGIYSGNVASIKAYTRAGWIIEGRLKWHYATPRGWEDRVIVSCFNPRLFRFVNGEYVPAGV